MPIEEILRSIRKELNISQEQLARELNISYTTINRWENSRRTPSRLAKMRLLEFCVAHGISKEIINTLECL
ncbi:helix-turn-helix domain-containing protein [Lawsonibacter faecis]|uniref:Helix-turn-helix transcriptional regulator n=1 Tax=Lawsonibacter faecis TaxID=2763052 RepID=A0A8J6JJ82_9FIRM|nr:MULTISPECIES: helix-turn-helix transcriptional regulator [Oscillospiraceae]KAB4837411.1 helix-turn-helix transcriptional regulator [Bacteroides thetaiotaomicron]MTQ98784.1 helix-turn-helix domain-containing protein [Pseudoflavonifractor sp. BIOML-A16]MTR07879.1 helix-turn-helix domain-containing protein [Pseudoflavonifractor sp. BIOML-A15]MTR34288.1 helix-turn-helix domain-containing protein [Pseudoflavonifractor sp. BIOML-A14]MTR74846.1 helix-turn-helix domain-containing protein [Pseudofla